MHLTVMFRLFSYATTSTDRSVYIFGGIIDNSPHSNIIISGDVISTIAKYSDGVWTEAGSLKDARGAHGAIAVDGVTMIIGGEPIM